MLDRIGVGNRHRVGCRCVRSPWLVVGRSSISRALRGNTSVLNRPAALDEAVGVGMKRRSQKTAAILFFHRRLILGRTVRAVTAAVGITMARRLYPELVLAGRRKAACKGSSHRYAPYCAHAGFPVAVVWGGRAGALKLAAAIAGAPELPPLGPLGVPGVALMSEA